MRLRNQQRQLKTPHQSVPPLTITPKREKEIPHNEWQRRKVVKDRIRALKKALGLTQQELSETLKLAHGTVGNWLQQNRKPGSFACLLLAGLSKTEEDRNFFLALAELTSEHRDLIGLALQTKPSPD